ncbi:hypothetical protein EB822_01495 [Flavobacteriaceae bacterium PRS1]|nr:hypothetical protein EB822_01495 [Flavobacteriaceae bacterium PRS1]
MFLLISCSTIKNELIPTDNIGGYKIELKQNSNIEPIEIHIFGKVIDVKTKEPISHTQLILGCFKAQTSGDGEYSFIFKSTKDTMLYLKAISVGYKTIETKFLNFTNNNYVKIDFYLTEDDRPIINCEGVVYNYKGEETTGNNPGALSGLNLFETKISSKKYGKQWIFSTNFYTGISGYVYVTAQTTFSSNLYPIAVQDDLVIELFTNNVALDWALEFANNQLVKEKLNDYFWSRAQDATKNIVKSYLTFDSNYKVPKSRTLVLKVQNMVEY